MANRIETKSSARKELATIPANIAVTIISNIKALAHNSRPEGCKKLTGTDYSYRVRVGNYRVVYSIFDDQMVIQVIKIGHRKDIYT
ncbi:MAG: type II toxin-antitoxin system RelE family toxin [Methylococcales bacterium]